MAANLLDDRLKPTARRVGRAQADGADEAVEASVQIGLVDLERAV
jgi:hypothetical protein